MRTPDPLVRNQVLCPAEQQAHWGFHHKYYGKEIRDVLITSTKAMEQILRLHQRIWVVSSGACSYSWWKTEAPIINWLYTEEYELYKSKSYVNSFTRLIKATAGLGNTNETIKPTSAISDASGRINYPKRDVAYRMINGKVRKQGVSRHPDERVDQLLRLDRNSETTLAIDKLRSVRWSAEHPKMVWICM